MKWFTDIVHVQGSVRKYAYEVQKPKTKPENVTKEDFVVSIQDSSIATLILLASCLSLFYMRVISKEVDK